MSNRNQPDTKTEKLLSNLLKFFFIFFVLVIIILSAHYMGFLDHIETPSTNPTTTVTTVSTVPTTLQTTDTQTTGGEQETVTTTTAITYPPATMPTINATTAQTTIPTAPKLDISDEAMKELIEVRYLTIHLDKNGNIPENSGRSCEKLTSLKNIVVHYVANPGTSADQNWRYFNNRNTVSAHFIIGLEGEIIQALPLDEVAWAVGTTEGNYTSISIECCHPDATGKFTDETYESLVRLVSWLCNTLELDRDAVIRHYDYPRYTSSGVEWHKQCPLYYANASDPASHKRWKEFKNDLIIYE